MNILPIFQDPKVTLLEQKNLPMWWHDFYLIWKDQKNYQNNRDRSKTELSQDHLLNQVESLRRYAFPKNWGRSYRVPLPPKKILPQ